MRQFNVGKPHPYFSAPSIQDADSVSLTATAELYWTPWQT